MGLDPGRRGGRLGELATDVRARLTTNARVGLAAEAPIDLAPDARVSLATEVPIHTWPRLRVDGPQMAASWPETG